MKAYSFEAKLMWREGLATNTGHDLALISTRRATDSCRIYEGIIKSLNGETEGYPTQEARGRSHASSGRPVTQSD